VSSGVRLTHAFVRNFLTDNWQVPLRRDLPHRAAAQTGIAIRGVSSFLSRAIDIAAGVDQELAGEKYAVGEIKVVQSGFNPVAVRKSEFESDAVVVGAAISGGTIEISSAVASQPAFGIRSSGGTGEAVQELEVPGSGLGQFEYRPRVMGATGGRKAIKVSRRVGNQRAPWAVSVAALAGMYGCFRLDAVGRAQLVNHDLADATSLGHSIKIAGGIEDEAARW